MMAEYDILYMQRHEHLTGLPIVQPWKVNDDDIEYIRRSMMALDYIEGEPTCHRCWIDFDHNDPFLLLCSRHAAADAMYEALVNCQIMLQDYNSADRLINRVDEQGGWTDFSVPKPKQLLILVGETLALADGD